jgi:hypothetical protein
LDRGVKKEKKDEHAVLIVVQLAVVRGIALAAHFVKGLKKRVELIEVLQSLEAFGIPRFRRRSQHRDSPVQDCHPGSD